MTHNKRLTTAEKDAREWRFIVKVFRAAMFCFFMAYLLFTGSATVGWIKGEYWRAQPPEKTVEKALAVYADTGSVALMENYLGVIEKRHAPTVARMLDEQATTFPPLLLARLADWHFHAGDADEAAFYQQLFLFRMSADMYRCANPRRAEATKKLTPAFAGDAEYTVVLDTEEKLAANLRRVLDWDTANPPAYERDQICKIAALAVKGDDGIRDPIEADFDYRLAREMAEARIRGDAPKTYGELIRLVEDVRIKQDADIAAGKLDAAPAIESGVKNPVTPPQSQLTPARPPEADDADTAAE